MKKFLKKLLCAVTVLVMLAALFAVGISASLAPVVSNVIFQGTGSSDFDFLPGSSYTDSDLFMNFKDVMPGDVLREKIYITNSSPYMWVDFYLRAVPHDEQTNPLSPKVDEVEESVASMEDFLSQLYMRVWNEGELIFEASPDKTGGLTENVFLGTLSGYNALTVDVELEVPIDLGNQYANRVGEVDWLFLAECHPYPPGGGSGGSGGGSDGDDWWEDDDDTADAYNITVKKYWKDEELTRPKSVTVYLLRDGEKYDEATLFDLNYWTYNWTNLDEDYDWDVVEKVPAGYTAEYLRSGNLIMITNTKTSPNNPLEPDETTPEGTTPTVPGKPITPDKPVETDESGESINPTDPTETDESGKPINPADPTETDESGKPISPANPTETDESGMPISPADPTETDDNGEPLEPFTPNRPARPVSPDDSEKISGVGEPVRLSVRMEWTGDEDSLDNRPALVAVTLFNGTDPVEIVYLDEHSGWQYTWSDLAADGEWTVIEVDVPGSYTAAYSVEADGTVVITNTASLLKTGQIKWHIPVLFCVGAVFIGVGLVFVFKKRKQIDE